MLIEEQIKKLQRVKAKIDLYKKVQSNVTSELTSVNQDKEHKALEAEYPGLLAEFVQEMDAFCSKRIEMLGNGEQPRRVSEPTPNGGAVNDPGPPQPATKPVTPPIQMIDDEPADPLRFLMKYKHLDGKKVTWMSKDGQVTGTVRGLLTPNVIVESDNGFTLPVPARELKEVK
jgi:hypothetical protein